MTMDNFGHILWIAFFCSIGFVQKTSTMPITETTPVTEITTEFVMTTDLERMTSTSVSSSSNTITEDTEGRTDELVLQDNAAAASRRSAVLRALSKDISHRTVEAFHIYCDQVYSYVNFGSVEEYTTPEEKCAAFSAFVKEYFQIPSAMVADSSIPMTKEILLEHQKAVLQLHHSLEQSADAIAGSLLLDTDPSIRVCKLNPARSFKDVCSISCHPERKPEQELSCTIRRDLLPRLRNYNDLMTIEFGPVRDLLVKHITVDKNTERALLRYHSISIINYAREQTSANMNLHERWNH